MDDLVIWSVLDVAPGGDGVLDSGGSSPPVHSGERMPGVHVSVSSDRAIAFHVLFSSLPLKLSLYPPLESDPFLHLKHDERTW